MFVFTGYTGEWEKMISCERAGVQVTRGEIPFTSAIWEQPEMIQLE